MYICLKYEFTSKSYISMFTVFSDRYKCKEKCLTVELRINLYLFLKQILQKPLKCLFLMGRPFPNETKYFQWLETITVSLTPISYLFIRHKIAQQASACYRGRQGTRISSAMISGICWLPDTISVMAAFIHGFILFLSLYLPICYLWPLLFPVFEMLIVLDDNTNKQMDD